jgi:CRISPR system Cascade subunit CasD
MIAGLLGNALGWDHSEGERFNRLQDRIQYAARIDRKGTLIVDFQTVDLGQDHMMDTGWTTWGRPERRGGLSGDKTHIRYRHYRAGAIVTAVVTLQPEADDPSLRSVEYFLRQPERPLFIGRKCCIPASPIYRGSMEGPTLLAMLSRIPPPPDVKETRMFAQWPAEEEALPESREILSVEHRDWINQIHVGESRVRQGWIDLVETSDV